MSGVFRSTENLFHIGPGRRDAMGDQKRRLGRNRDPYYGNAAQSVIDGKHGMKHYADSVLGKGKGRKAARSGASQLLGGG